MPLGVIVPSGGQYLNTESGLSAPGGFLDRLIGTVDQNAQNEAVLHGLSPALAATGVPMPAPTPGILSRLFGTGQDQSAPAASGGVLSRLLGGGQDAPAPAMALATASASPSSAASPSALASQALSFFTDRGLAPVGAAGLVGNLMRESGLRTSAFNPGDGADGSNSTGLAQWNGARAAGLQQYAAANGGHPGDFGTQLGYVWHELNTTEKPALAALQAAQNPLQAAAAGVGYERPAGWSPNNPTGAHDFGKRFAATVGLSGGGNAGGGDVPASAMAFAGPQNTGTSIGPVVRGPQGGPMPQATSSPDAPHGVAAALNGGTGDPAQPSIDQIRTMAQNPDTRAQAMDLWRQRLAANQPAPASSGGPISLPGGLTTDALGAMIAEPATRAEGIAIWKQALSPKDGFTLGEGQSRFDARGRLLASGTDKPVTLSPGQSAFGSGGGAPIASVAPAPVKLGPGDALVPPTGGAAIAGVPALRHFSDVNGRVVASDPQNGASTDVTPAGVPTSSDLKATEGANADILSRVSTSQQQAIAASRTLDAIARQQQALDKGAFTGGGASTKLAISSALAGILGIDSDKVANTQEFIAAANSKAAEIARQLSQSGHTTNADLNMAKVIGGADINSSIGTLREIGRAQQQIALDTINRHNASVDEGGRFNPALAQRSSFYKVETPKAYDFASSNALRSARAAVAGGADRGKVIERLKSRGIDPEGL